MSQKSQIIDPEIEWDFDLRARQPKHGEYKARWREASEETRSHLACLVDVPCGPHTDMTFDIFPASRTPAPCFIFLHGGFWRSSDKSESSFVANAFAEFGITTVIMNYRLVPAVTISEIIAELRMSIIHLFEKSHLYGIDQDNIHIGGFSAGGLLAARVFGTDWTEYGYVDPVIRNGMALSGIFDPEPLLLTSHNSLLGLTRSQARALNVIGASEIVSNLALVACGAAETSSFKNQTSRYANISRQAGHATHELWIKDRHHYDVVLDFSDPNSQLAMASRQMILGWL